MKHNVFTAGVEKLINPITVGTLHFLQSYNEMLPVSTQNKIIEKSSKQNPYMGFVVEPYCTFLFQKIIDLDYFKQQLPSNFELVKTTAFAGEEPDYYVIISLFNARTSAFMGSRVEAYLIAENKDTGLMSWIIVDYITNTISHDPKFGLTKPSVHEGYVTTDFSGNVVAKMDDYDHTLELEVNIEDGVIKMLDERLWVEGNLSVSYGTKYDLSGKTFGLKFDPREMSTALDVDVTKLNHYQNSWFDGYVENVPSKIVVFKYAQHFISDSPGSFSDIRTKSELQEVVDNIDFTDIKPYSTDNITKNFTRYPLIFIIVIIVLTILLVVK
ncbi:hypothetical protein RZE82_09235 [Mollicutes bacterium LVI A0039]|nr:hypothetical protein RZE82_09235 [Mollicutes bacterium LVI A0039]